MKIIIEVNSTYAKDLEDRLFRVYCFAAVSVMILFPVVVCSSMMFFIGVASINLYPYL